MKYTFPENFWWGSAASGPQTEGASTIDGKKPSVWDHWYKIEPEKFFNGVGPQNTSNFYYQYKEDIALMKQTGHNSFRTSIQWSRLIPDGTGEVNPKAVEFYNNVLDEMIANGVEPFINLYHFDMPMAMQEKGGFENRAVVDAYANYAKTCFELFGSKVKYWFTFNEPIVPVEMGYLYDMHYPNVHDFGRAAQVAYHTALAHALAVKYYHELNQDGKIGVILNLTPSYPRSQNPADLKAAHLADLFYNRSFLDPVTKGKYPEDLVEILRERDFIPEHTAEDLAIIKNNIIDILGVNYYQPRRVKAKEYMPHPDAPFIPEHLFDNYEMPYRKMNPYRGWEIYEKAIYDMAINLRDNYNNIPFFISENGMGVEGEDRYRGADGKINDHYRIDFIKDHLRYLHQAIDEGANCLGYHLWTFMDCWSWANAYKNRYGLVEVDLDNNFKRTIKASGYWYKELTANNGFED